MPNITDSNRALIAATIEAANRRWEDALRDAFNVDPWIPLDPSQVPRFAKIILEETDRLTDRVINLEDELKDIREGIRDLFHQYVKGEG